jgi:hypothetical protein
MRCNGLPSVGADRHTAIITACQYAEAGEGFHSQGHKMSNVQQVQQTTKDLGDAALSSANTFARSLQTIAAAHFEYIKKAMQHGSEFMSQLTSVKEPTEMMELHSEYVKSAYKLSAAEAKKIHELYADLFKQTTKPLEDLISKNKAA